ncbi:MAG: hypothetical protein P8R35_02620 [Planctomycetota bacterium]|jgi:hypothetical protein|nr:hypothetical protein [Planctomycetota bacterium]
MKAILLIITLAASVSCAVPTAVGTDFATEQFRLGGRIAASSTSAGLDGAGYAVGDTFALEGGRFFTSQLELGGTVEFFTSDFLNDAQLFTGFARYYLQSEGNVRPFVLIGAGLYNADDGVGDIYRLGAGVSQFISDRTSFEISVEQQFSSYVADPDSVNANKEVENDAVNVYLGVNIFL